MTDSKLTTLSQLGISFVGTPSPDKVNELYDLLCSDTAKQRREARQKKDYMIREEVITPFLQELPVNEVLILQSTPNNLEVFVREADYDKCPRKQLTAKCKNGEQVTLKLVISYDLPLHNKKEYIT